MSDYKRLRELALAAIAARGTYDAGDAHIRTPEAISNYRGASQPETILALLDALEAAQRDARRYRYMRRQKSFEWSKLTPPELDTAIDRAIAEQGEAK